MRGQIRNEATWCFRRSGDWRVSRTSSIETSWRLAWWEREALGKVCDRLLKSESIDVHRSAKSVAWRWPLGLVVVVPKPNCNAIGERDHFTTRSTFSAPWLYGYLVCSSFDFAPSFIICLSLTVSHRKVTVDITILMIEWLSNEGYMGRFYRRRYIQKTILWS